MNLNDLPILEPLSKATSQVLAQLALEEQDFLEIWLIEHETRMSFGMRVLALRKKSESLLSESIPPKRVFPSPSGEELILSPRFPSREAREFLHRLVERSPIKGHEGSWDVGATDMNALMVHSCWPKERIIFHSDLAKSTFLFLIRRFLLQSVRAQQQAKFHLEGEVPPLPPEFHEHPDYPLAGYQKAALAFSLRQEATALFMEQGTGKTPVAIQRVCTEARMKRSGQLGEKKGMLRALIICPRQVRLNWQNEFDKFATVAGKVTVIRGGKMKRIRHLTHAVREEDDCAFSAVIMSYESASIDTEAMQLIPWDLCILDESHFIKSVSANRTKALCSVVRDNSDRRMELTGTPIPNSVMDFYAQAEFLGHGLSGFATLKGYKEFFGRWAPQGSQGRQAFLGEANVPLFKERMARIAFRISKEKAGLNLPPKVYDVVEIELTSYQQDLYAQVADALFVEIEAGLEKVGKDRMTAEHVLTKLLRLAQITSGFVTLDGDEVADKKILPLTPNPKLDALLETVKESLASDQDMKVLVWAVFVQDLRVISEALNKAGIKHALYYGATSEADRESAVYDFNNDPSLRVMVGNPATMAEGLNLLGYNPNLPPEQTQSTYCGHQIFYSTNWSMVQRAQAEDRAHRRGTKMPVRITDLVAPGTIDQEMRARVTGKIHTALNLQDVRAILERIVNVDFS
jgi:hypothetical protein